MPFNLLTTTTAIDRWRRFLSLVYALDKDGAPPRLSRRPLVAATTTDAAVAVGWRRVIVVIDSNDKTTANQRRHRSSAAQRPPSLVDFTAGCPQKLARRSIEPPDFSTAMAESSWCCEKMSEPIAVALLLANFERGWQRRTAIWTLDFSLLFSINKIAVNRRRCCCQFDDFARVCTQQLLRRNSRGAANNRPIARSCKLPIFGIVKSAARRLYICPQFFSRSQPLALADCFHSSSNNFISKLRLHLTSLEAAHS